MRTNRYCMSFTDGRRLHYESIKLATPYLDLDEWNSIRDKIISKNLLQIRTLNTFKRTYSEFFFRIRTLAQNKLEFILECNHQEHAYLLWDVFCRLYRFISDFSTGVLRVIHVQNTTGSNSQKEINSNIRRSEI